MATQEQPSSSSSSAGGKPPETVRAPPILLPKGGGAIRGIGEKFAANPVTGTGSMTVPLPVSPGRSGFGPQLSLSYDSGSGNGPFGLGWNLSLPTITRKTDKGLPRYEDATDSDTFILSGAEDLVPVLKQDGGGDWVRDEFDREGYRIVRYRPRTEWLFARIERWTRQTDGETYWRSISRDNVTTCYGKSVNSRIADPADSSRVFSWLISESFDDKGNAITYEYVAENSSNISSELQFEARRTELSRSAGRYLKHVRHGNQTPREPAEDLSKRSDWLFELIFDYGENHLETVERLDETGEQEIIRATIIAGAEWPVRSDPFSSYKSAFEVRTYRLCRRILMFHHFPDELGAADRLVRCLELSYDESPIASFLTSIMQSGCASRPDGSYLKKAQPPIEFEYSRADIQAEVHDLDPESLENLPVGLDGQHYEWVDLDGEGAPGALIRTEQGWHYKRNYSPIADLVRAGVTSPSACFGASETVASLPSSDTTNQSKLQFIDLAGDGHPDVVQMQGLVPGFHERNSDGTWDSFTPFASLPRINWNDPNLRYIDLTGDGLADILITEDQVLRWYPSLGEEGFDVSVHVDLPLDEEDGALLIFADGTEAIYLADLSGDGLTDVVRIRNGEVCYWPNVGYGQFGPKVTMDNAPWFDAPDLFNQKRIRLADIDGSGTTDILYLKGDHIQIFRNQSGNGWADAEILTNFPSINDLSSVQVVDLLGNGTACLVWSSSLPGDAGRQIRYIDLMGGQKPHLLIKTINNLGAETVVQYAPSTRFYLQDKLLGQPWVTKLSFPVHVVERVEVYDRISRSYFVTRYAYHHGYFDGPEREFRGFGMVEQWDTEKFTTLSGSDAFPLGENVDETSHVPPILTKTWFHTGAYLEGETISQQYSSEYYVEPGLSADETRAQLLPDTVLPDGLNTIETREAVRALRGAILRQEVYALDGTEKSVHPYTVSQRNYSLRLLQALEDNPHAVFFVHPREQIDYHYERESSDPRTSHTLTIEVDQFGNVLKSLAVGYGRREPDTSLSSSDQAKQTALSILAVENEYTNPIEEDDDFRSPLLCEAKGYQITGASPTDGVRFAFEEASQMIGDASEISYEASPDGSLQKRLISATRTIYRSNDLSGALPLGELQSLALPYASYALAFTPGLVEIVYEGKNVDALFSAEGGYVDLDADSHWWLPSGCLYFSSDSDASADEELAEAQAHFFQPRRFEDPLGATSTVDYDSHDLLPTQTTDAIGNTTSATNDYRVLQPASITDANGNRASVAFDTLGFVAGTAVMGKESETLGDSLTAFVADLNSATVSDYLSNPLSDPHAILKDATTRLVYDLFAYYRTRDGDSPQPAVVSTISRETHLSDLASGVVSKVQVSFSYSDGFGREIQKKLQAEPGPVEKGATDIDPRWVGSGWTIFNNKGNPVRKYEPFFTATHLFEFARFVGVSPILIYDPPQRVVATIHSNHAWEKVVFDPWQQVSWDVNDTVLVSNPAADLDVGASVARLVMDNYQPTWHAQRASGALGEDEQVAAEKTALHADTPARAYLDSLGRPFLSVSNNGSSGEYETRTDLDIRGLPLAITDARGNRVMSYTYDLLKRRLHSNSPDAGERWNLPNAAGNSIRAWDSREQAFRTTYDPLQRPTHLFVQRSGSVEVLVERSVFGEALSEAAKPLNLLGKVYQQYDGAGVVTNEAFDFKGNLFRASRRLAREYKATIDWTVLKDLTDTGEIESAAEAFLENETFTQSTAYDALNRPASVTLPDQTEIQPAFNEANLLEQVKARLRGAADWTTFVKDIDYNAKGQRERIEYGNSVVTKYEYNEVTFRLESLKTTRDTDGDLQNLSYHYDPAGNFTSIRDDAQQTFYFAGEEVTPDAEYVYDAIYRLIEATGREHIGQTTQVDENDPLIQTIPHPNDTAAMRRYGEKYFYDEVGNILKIAHTADSGNWTRYYEYEASSNRLAVTSLPGDDPFGPYSARYSHDAHGNMTSMPHLASIQWDSKDRMQQADLGGGGMAYFVYDASGQRVRKVHEHNGSTVEERIYLGGYEIYRKSQGGSLTLERETIHVMDGKNRIALVETKTYDEMALTDPEKLIRYQLGNHLGSCCVETDYDGSIISYEEYHPYGTTAYHSSAGADKRYRYTAKERDDETGLCYHRARYYLPWLGRWASVDPQFGADGTNGYSFCRDNPVCFTDPLGLKASPELIKGATGALTSRLGYLDTNDDGMVDNSQVTVRSLAGTIVLYTEGNWDAQTAARAIKGVSVDQFKAAQSTYLDMPILSAFGAPTLGQERSQKNQTQLAVSSNLGGGIVWNLAYAWTGDQAKANAAAIQGAAVTDAAMAAASGRYANAPGPSNPSGNTTSAYQGPPEASGPTSQSFALQRPAKLSPKGNLLYLQPVTTAKGPAHRWKLATPTPSPSTSQRSEPPELQFGKAVDQAGKLNAKVAGLNTNPRVPLPGKNTPTGQQAHAVPDVELPTAPDSGAQYMDFKALITPNQPPTEKGTLTPNQTDLVLTYGWGIFWLRTPGSTWLLPAPPGEH